MTTLKSTYRFTSKTAATRNKLLSLQRQWGRKKNNNKARWGRFDPFPRLGERRGLDWCGRLNPLRAENDPTAIRGPRAGGAPHAAPVPPPAGARSHPNRPGANAGTWPLP